MRGNSCCQMRQITTIRMLHKTRIIVYSISQHSTMHGDWTACSERAGLSAQSGISLPPVNTVLYMVTGQKDTLWVSRRCSELSAERSLPSVNTVAYDVVVSHSFTHSLIFSFADILTHSPIYSFTHKSTHSLTYPPTHSSTHSLTQSFTHSSTHSLIH